MRSWKNCFNRRVWCLFSCCFFLSFATEPFDTWSFPPPSVLAFDERLIFGENTAELYVGLVPVISVRDVQVKVLPVQGSYLAAFDSAEACAAEKLAAGEMLKCRFVLQKRRFFSLAALRVEADFMVSEDEYGLYAAGKIAEAHLFTAQREELLGRLNELSEKRTEQFRVYVSGRSFIPGAVDVRE